MNRRSAGGRGAWWGVTLVLAGLLAAGVGCESRMLWSYRDDPYLAQYAKLGEEECLRKLNSVYTDDRRVALRVLSHLAAEYRKQGKTARADRLVKFIIEQFSMDKSRKVRCAIMRVCLPECGPGSEQAQRFLRRQIAGGEWSTEAAFSLAAINPAQGLALLEPLTHHPSPQIRFQAAMALTVLGDPDGAVAVERVIQEMQRPKWPRNIVEQSLRVARACLRERARRLWAKGDAPKTESRLQPRPQSQPRPIKLFKPRPGPALPEFSRPAAKGSSEE